ncbi:MAG: NADH-quinone oxidoreductase subunit H [Verrucomicrobiae bacterium]|nr:NADH-quinone oxidoreductase subunit H [Verrucomicrobiae bacterium]
MQNALQNLFLSLVNVAVVLAVAPFFEGIIRKLTAMVQSRQGPPVAQPYFDLLKLLGKEDIESGESPAMQRFSSYLSLATLLVVAAILPVGGRAVLGGSVDCILLIYLLTLSGIATLLAGLAAGSTYSLMGMSREMMCMMLLEPLFAVALLIGALHTGSLRLDAILNGSVYSSAGFPFSGYLMLGVMLFSLQAFVGRLPFDVTEAETEIMEGPLMEYSGPKLAMFKYARMAKLVIYCFLLVALFAPWGCGSGDYLMNWLLLLAKVAVVVVLVTVVAATHARYRIDQVIRYYGILLGISLLALGLAVFGY